jgi:hypothetical protein
MVCDEVDCNGTKEKTACKYFDALLETGKVQLKHNRFVDTHGDLLNLNKGKRGLKALFLNKDTKSNSVRFAIPSEATLPGEGSMLPTVLSALASMGHEEEAEQIWKANN